MNKMHYWRFRAVATLVTGAGMGAAIAQQAPPDAASRKLAFHIAQQPVGRALTELGQQSGLTIIVASTLSQGVVTPAVGGVFTPDEVLHKILGPVGLHAEYLDAHTVAVRAAMPMPQAHSDTSRLAVASASDESDNSGSDGPASDPSNDADTDSNKQKERAPLEQVVVTGTHIRGNAPIGSELIVISHDDIDRSGYATIGDVMRSLPQNFSGAISPAITGNNTTPVGGGNPAAASAPDLRGIGASSTLTLIDGQRLALGYRGTGSVDISSIPLDAIERIEVVPDGTSAMYGSDAVAGIVNIILKKSYQGLQANVSYGNATDGGGVTRRVSTLLGTNWSSGNIMLGYEHAGQDAVGAAQRDFTSTVPLPYDLLPETSSNSYLLSLRQDISEDLSGFLKGNYFKKGVSIRATQSVTPYTQDTRASSSQYGITAGLNMDWGGQWASSLIGSAAKQVYRENDAFYLTASPIDLTYTPVFYQGTVRSVEWVSNGPLFDFGTGLVRAALGAGYRHESLLTSSGTRGRNVPYAFTELSVPLLEPSEQLGRRRLDLSVSGRYEHYSEFGNETVPKVGLLYSPLRGVNLRASWGKSFHAPDLSQIYGDNSLFLLPLATNSGGTANVVYLSGANPNLGPETARSWSAGLDYEPPTIEKLKIAATYFSINYSNRVSSIQDSFSALTDPLDAPFVQYNPAAAEVQSLVNKYGITASILPPGTPYDPAAFAAIVEGRNINITQQEIKGIDASASYGISTSIGHIELSIDTAYLRFQERLTPFAPEQVLSGVAFNPPRFRGRGGVTWTSGPWSLTTLANYVSPETDTYQTGNPRVASWTTVDAALAFAPSLSGAAKGLRISASVQNILDRDPPYVASSTSTNGLNYDPFNTTPLGRFVTIGVVKAW